MLKPEIRQIYDHYKEVKKPLQSYSSAKSLKKSNSKASLKRQSSSPYLHAETVSKVSRSKSPKRKNKSVDMMKLKSVNTTYVPFRNKKFGTSFESLKKSSGDVFSHMSQYKKEK